MTRNIEEREKVTNAVPGAEAMTSTKRNLKVLN